MDGEIVDHLPIHDALCIDSGVYPEHTYERFDAIVTSTERALNAIGAREIMVIHVIEED